MKFIKKHKLNEGLFGTKDQMKKRLEREAQLSDEEIVAKDAATFIKQPYINYMNAMLEEKHVCDILNASTSSWKYEDRTRGDRLNILPQFFNPYCLNLMTQQCYLRKWYLAYEIGRAVDIDFNNNTVYVEFTLGSPEVNHSGGPTKFPIALLVDYIKTKTAKENINSKLETIMKYDIVLNHWLYRTFGRQKYEKNPVEEKLDPKEEKMIDFFRHAHYKVNIVWKLKEDIIVFALPNVFTNSFGHGIDFKSNEYINQNVYRFMPVEKIKKLGPIVLNRTSVIENMPFDKSFAEDYNCNNYEELADYIKQGIEDSNLSVDGGHIYLSTGYSQKNYLIV